jgi:tetratricopeptide (TPR) repeat protein
LRILRAVTAPPRAAAFERALTVDPRDADTLYNLGVALQKRRSLSDAVRAYRQAPCDQPDLIAAQFNLGVAHQENRLRRRRDSRI